MLSTDSVAPAIIFFRAHGSPPDRARWHPVMRWMAVLVSLATVTTHLHAACDTNQTAINLGNWSVVQFGPFVQGQIAARWVLSQLGTVATQEENADASIFLSPFSLQNDQI